jgi:hypothetical protein
LGRARELALSLQASAATPKASEKAWIALANELEQQLGALNVARLGPKWVSTSERWPDIRGGQYMAVGYDSKCDMRLLLMAMFDGTRLQSVISTFHPVYWLDGLTTPVKLDPWNPITYVWGPVDRSGSTRVERFLSSLPAFHATGPKTRVRFLQGFAEFLEAELDSDAPIPRWVDARQRLPSKIGKRVVVATDDDGASLATASFDGTFLTKMKVLHWLENLRCPAFYYQESKGLQVVAPHPRDVAPRNELEET